MSTAKLTLSIPKNLLGEAKVYSQKTHQPLSRLVSHYFSLLTLKWRDKEGGDLVTSRVKQITGIAKSDRGEKDLLFESLRSKYL